MSLISRFFRKFLRKPPSRTPPSIESIVCATARHYGVPRELILGRSRIRRIVISRQVATWFARKYTPRSSTLIGRRIGRRDHSTVLSSVKKIDARLATDERLQNDIAQIKTLLGI